MNDLNYLFNDISLYTKDIFNIFELSGEDYIINEDEYKRYLSYIGVNQSKIISYCHCCKKEFPFSIKKELFSFLGNSKNNSSYMDIILGNNNDIQFYMNGGIYGTVGPYSKEILKLEQIWYIEYFFECTNNKEHLYIMVISIELKNGKFIVRKVGQNPSMLTIKGFDFDKYKKYLEKINAYSDYKKADLSNADHFYVGAYAYLRRVFEKMINDYLDGVKLPDNHMDTKIEAAKDKFDNRVQKLLKNLYGVLSISIHELDEEESKKYYNYLKAVIDMQLEYIKTESEKEEQSKELEGVLSQIVNMVSNDKL